MVRVRLYGWISERMGWREKSLSFEGTVHELLSLMDPEIPELIYQGRLMVAVNHSLERDLGRRVAGDDIIAVLPTFSGG